MVLSGSRSFDLFRLRSVSSRPNSKNTLIKGGGVEQHRYTKLLVVPRPLLPSVVGACFPKGSCTQIVHTLAPKYLYRDDLNAYLYTIWVHGPLWFGAEQAALRAQCEVPEYF